MAVDFGRWWKYAQAKLSSAVEAENRELDALEAEREAELADKPWLAADGEAPTLDEARARIEWEAGQARDAGAPTSSPEPDAPEPVDPEVAQARVELDRQARESKARLDAIREELGVDPPTAGES